MNAPTFDPTNGQDRAWLAAQVDAARRVAACPGFVINRDIASALVAVADAATVYVVIQTEGVAVELDSCWRSYEEAEERRDAQERNYRGLDYGWHIQALPLQGAR